MTIGTQISDMTPISFDDMPDDASLPWVTATGIGGYSLLRNYRSPVAEAIRARVSYTALAAASGAALVGTTGPSNVQTDLDARPTSAALAASDGATLVGFLQSGTGAVARTVEEKNRDTLNAKDFGAVFDGVTDDRAALQKAIDEAFLQGKKLVLPGGTAKISGALDLRGKYVFIEGAGADETMIQASVAMPLMINIEEASDVIFSPFTLRNLRIDGDYLAECCISVRYRHHSLISQCYIGAATDTVIKEIDAWKNRRELLLIYGAPTLVDLMGSNHNSHWDTVTLVNATDTFLKIGAAGTASDGNLALLFSSFDVEFSLAGYAAKGVTVAEGAIATFDTSYLGENVEGPVIENSGQLMINGGVIFFGHAATAYGIRPLKGRCIINATELKGQTFGSLGNLIHLTDAEVNAIDGYGRVSLTNVNTNALVGGTPVFPGSPLDDGPAGIVFAPRLGREWAAESNDVTLTDTVIGNARSVTCDSVIGAAPIIGLQATVSSTSWKLGEPLYLVIVYKATKDLTFRVATGVLGTEVGSLGPLPATTGIVKTAVQLNVDAFATSGTNVLEMFMNATAAVSDNLTLYEAIIADSRMVSNINGVVGNLYKC